MRQHIVSAMTVYVDGFFAAVPIAIMIDEAICSRRHSAHRGNESIAVAGDRDDVVMLVSTLTKRPAQRGDLPDEIVLLHGRVRPDQAQQFVLAHDPFAMLEQDNQNLKRLCCDRDESILATERSLHRIDDERTEGAPAVVCRMRSGR